MSPYDWIEATAVATWMRESTWAFPGSLIVHGWALAFVCGISLLLALAVFGRAPRLLPPLLPRFLPLIGIAMTFSLGSGLLLLMTYPEQVLTSAVFFLKLGSIAVAVALAVSLQRKCAELYLPYPVSFPLNLKLRAAGMLLAWFVALAAGRLLYYTY